MSARAERYARLAAAVRARKAADVARLAARLGEAKRLREAAAEIRGTEAVLDTPASGADLAAAAAWREAERARAARLEHGARALEVAAEPLKRRIAAALVQIPALARRCADQPPD